MKLLLAATPLAGHLNPLLSLARIALAHGHEVLIATGSVMAPLVEATGATFTSLLDEADIDMSRFEERFPERSSIPAGPDQIRFDMERIFIDPMPAQARTLDRLIADYRPDGIVTDAYFMGRVPLFYSGERRPPIIALGITFLGLPRPDGAPIGPGLPPATTDDERARYAEIGREVNAMLELPVSAYFADKLRSVGIDAPLPNFFAAMTSANDVYLQPTAPSFEYDFGPSTTDIRFVGALPPALLHSGLPEWWDKLDSSRPIVLVTQGTVANADVDQLLNPALAALADRDDLQVVVVTGGRPADAITVPRRNHIFVTSLIDYTVLIPRLSLLVTNGGYGTVSSALSAGVPIVVAGRSEDKAEVAARIAWSGVGVRLDTVPPRVDVLRDAINLALTDPGFRERAQAMATEFRAIDTSRAVMQAIEEVVYEAAAPIVR